MQRAVDAGARLIGVNNRSLQTLEVDPTTFARLAPLIPDGIVRVAESGVRGPHDVIELARAGADVVLVGEALVTGRDPRTRRRRPGGGGRPPGRAPQLTRHPSHARPTPATATEFATAPWGPRRILRGSP